MTIKRDCTGTYLQNDEKIYQVCNIEETNKFEDSEIALVSFKLIDDCNGSALDVIKCERIPLTNQWIEVLKIK